MSISGLVPPSGEPGKASEPDPKAQETQEQSPTSESSVVSEENSPSESKAADSTAAEPPPAENAPSPEVSRYDQITQALLGRIGDVGSKSTFKMIVYGPPGGTKSGFLGGIENNLVYDLEDGNISMATQEAFTGKPRARGIKVMPFKSFAEADLLVERLNDHAEGFESWTCFSIDTFTDFYKRALEDEAARRWKLAPASDRAAKSQYGNEKEDYSPVNGQMLHFIRKLRNMDRDIVITAHARTVEPKGMPARTFPDFSESLASKIEAMMDVVGYIEMVKMEDGSEAPMMRTKSDGFIHAKSRIPLPTLMKNPNWNYMKAVWLEWKQKAEAAENL